jgi:geranylgeranyl diphosphate synthase type II
MDFADRIETALNACFVTAEAGNPPPKVLAAMRHAVFAGGARVRPSLCLAVADACDCDVPEIAEAAACAIEFMHCASLVHDDLPCFDDADIRRQKPSVHNAYGEALAVLAGDALILLAFDAVTRAAAAAPDRLTPVLRSLIDGVGLPRGIIAGQAWESESEIPAEAYRQAKTGALFVTATMSGAIAAGVDPEPWRRLGEKVGEAYQVADDLLDVLSGQDQSGKPVGQDIAHGRPSAVAELGVGGAKSLLESLIEEAVASVPDCRNGDDLRALVRLQAKRLAPKALTSAA